MVSAHACSEIGVKWFLFLKRSQNTLIKQIHNEPTYAKTDLRPFLTILGTRMRAALSQISPVTFDIEICFAYV